MSRKKFNPTSAQFLLAFSHFIKRFIEKYPNIELVKIESEELKQYVEQFSKMMFDHYENSIKNDS